MIPASLVAVLVPEPERHLSLIRAAALMGCERSTVVRLVNAGLLPASRITPGPKGRIMVRRQAILDYLEATRISPTASPCGGYRPVKRKYKQRKDLAAQFSG